MEKRYPLSKEELSLYLACTLNPERKFAYLVGWSVELPAQTDLARLERAIRAVFRKHRILNARIGRDENGELCKYDDGAEPVIERLRAEKSPVTPEDYYWDVELDGGRLYRAVIVETPKAVEVLLLFHHIVLDGTGRQVLVRDFEAAYQGGEIGEETLTAFAFAEREAAQEKSEAFEADRAYYRALLDDAEGAAPEPDRGGGKESFGRLFHTLSRVGEADVRAKKKSAGVRTSTIFLGALGWALSKFEGVERPVIASAMSGRTEELSESCGMFVRTLPMVCDCRDDRTVDEYLRTLDAQTTENRAHSLYTYLDMNRELGLHMSVCFAYQGDMISDRVLFDGEERRMGFLRADESDYELRLYLWRKDGEYLFEALYRADHYSRPYMDYLAGAFEQALCELLARDTLAQMQCLSEEQSALLDRFNATEKDYPVMDLVSMFRAAAEKYADRPAVLFRDKTLTYREVDEISERIAGCLRARGVGAGDVVSILIPRCEYMPIASLGVLKSGAAYQPLDPGYPEERLSFMMKDAGCKLLIADGALLEKVPEYKGAVLLTGDIPELPACTRIEEHPAPEDLFILLYTSGSTGVPKGVMLEHRNLSNFCQWYREYYKLDETCRVAAYASYGFDACMMDMYPTLTAGACLCIVEEEIRLDLVAMEAWFDRLGITHSFMTTQVGRQFYTMTETKTLQYLCVGGEKLVPVQPAEGAPSLINGYGPTECTILSTTAVVDRLYERIPIGTPLNNYKCYVVDKNLRRLPPLAPGELLIAGRGVARGYLNRPELTEKAFIKNPFSNEPDYARAYRTGDVARLLPDGNIDFIGRNDSQVKVRGFRIELTEIEGVIREFPGIQDATVQAFEDESTGEKFIAAYVVSEGEADIDALNGFIRARKPDYMVPAVTMQLDAIPLNQNQKVNKRALPKPELKARKKDAFGADAAPLNVLEQKLKKIVAEVVNTEDFGVTDRFGALGLSSISSIRLATQIYKQFDVRMNARELLAEGCVQSVENAILEKLLDQDETAEAPAEGREKAPAPRSCRLSFAQQGVYAECQIDPSAVTYNIPLVLRFPEGTGAEELRDAVLRVMEAHPYLLCRFTADENNEIVQEPIPDGAPEVPVLEMAADAFEAHKAAFVRPFDLAKGPAVRFEIVRADALYLLVDMHHLVSDGTSMDIFFRQLCLALDGETPERERYDYYDFVAEETIAPGVEEFFAGQMAEVEEATQLIPDIFEEDLPHTEKSVSVPTDFAAVKTFAQENGVTPAGVYLAASFLAYGRYVCEDTVAIATISNGRGNLKLADTMGMFVNTLPLVATIDNGEETKSFLRRVAKNFSDTIEHENYPFARIASKYDFRPMASYTYQIGVISSYHTKRGTVAVGNVGEPAAKLPVGVYITGEEGTEAIRVTYDSALFSEAMMRGFAESVENAVRGLMACRTLADISLTGEERWKALDAFNKPWDLNYDRADTVVTAFGRNARTQPDKTAAVFRDKAYTYRELDELTDRLAAKLYERACEITGKTSLAEEVAAILLPRDENVFILPLAAVKAGLAYEPLDPSYPKERLNFMVKDAGVCLLIAEEDLLDHVDEYDGAVLTVRELYDMPDAPAVPAAPKPEDLFILLYTSGSTGTPKGCQIEHRNMVAYAHGVRSDFYRSDDRIAAYASFGFDVNMSDIFCTLLNGGTVYLIPEEIRMDLDALAAYFDEAGITALLLTTQVGVQFLQNHPALKTLRMLVMGGEKLPAVDPSRLSYTIVNGYGPTENCCGVSLFPICAWEPNIPIGKPMATIHGYVLDKTGHRLPAGAAGEYCLSGPQVSRGYLNRPDKTAEAYEACPFNDFRMYHTGDIVRYRQNGDVEFVGRKDGQVKIRGFRIETKEVEAVIRGFEGIRDVTVQAYDYEGGGKYLAAFVVSEEPVDAVRLGEFIKEQKPAYMVPAVIMQIDRIPLTVNMKVDRKSLPKPEHQRAAYVAPEGKTEEDFCAIYAEVLGIERMSAEDDFFDLGGSSILAMKVVVAAGKAGYGIVYNDVFKHTTPRAMAAFINGGSNSEKAGAKAPAAGDPTSLPEIDGDGYDYRRIHELLARNTVAAFRNGERLPLGDVLLLGGTGYLGCSVLHELIVSHEGKLYCFVRPGRDESGEQRLKGMLRYYFGDDYAPLFGSRITVIEGDATDADALAAFTAPTENMTVINCAASVKHFARGNEIERANVESVRNLTAWCKANGARLVHISTGSVLGSRSGGMPPEGYRFDEHRLYVGQRFDHNQYVHSKYMAERHVFEEAVEHGLRAKVLRMGNLAPRLADGEFQINFRTNSYMNNFRAFRTLGVIPYDMLDRQVEFSPIDWLAKAVLALAQTPEDCVCFIPINPHRPLMGDVMRCLNEAGYPIRGVEGEDFAKALDAALSDEKTREAVGSLIAYRNNDDSRDMGIESCDNSLTVHILERMGLSWPETGTAYIRQFLDKLKQKGFFGGNEE